MGHPIVVNVQTSLLDLVVRTFRAGDAAFVGLDDHVALLRDPAFQHAIGLSLIFTCVSLSFRFAIGFALALFFARPFPGDGLLRSVLLLAWLLPAIVAGDLVRRMLDGDYGSINHRAAAPHRGWADDRRDQGIGFGISTPRART